MHVNLSFKEAVFGTQRDVNVRYQVLNRETGHTEVKQKTVSVDIPPGVNTGVTIRVPGQGAEGDPGAPAGNLLVGVVVQEDDYFQRDEYDVHTEVPISVIQAILGGTVDVKTLTGEVELKIPKGCQPNTKLMLRGKGIQQLHNPGKGNQIVHLKIEIPKELTKRQQELLLEFDQETRKSGKGISGRLHAAAESAFEKLFGKNEKGKKKQTDGDDKERATEEDDKKEAAQ